MQASYTLNKRLWVACDRPNQSCIVTLVPGVALGCCYGRMRARLVAAEWIVRPRSFWSTREVETLLQAEIG